MARRIEVQILGDSRSLERAFSRSSRAGRGFESNLRSATRGISRALAAAAAGATGLGVVTGRSFARFEESLDRIVGLAGGARAQVERFGDEILRLGPEVAKGPQELADTLYFVASAGVAVDKQMGVVRASARAAAAGLGATQVVADAVTSAMNAYGQANLSAARATDVLVNTVRFGKGEAESFAPVVGNVAALAAQLGVAFEEVGAALAAQTRLGISAEIAAVQLQAAFSGLLKTTPKAEKALRSVGLSSERLRKQLREKGLLSLLETLRVAFGDNTAAMARAFPNIRALRGLLALLGKNAESTREVFAGMADSTGALAKAFEAVSKDEAFRFQQTLSSLQVTGIRLGAVLAPLASVIARTTAQALGVVNDFLARLGAARTVRARLDVVWEGVQDAARGAEDLLGRAVRSIDFAAVFAEARGIADGLQKRLEEVDFSRVGKEIGDAIRDSVRFAIPAAKDLAERINRAIRAIDFEALGRELGPALATAIVTAFVTLLDPSFWAKNWDLALSVALVAFTGPIGRLAGKLVAPFARIGGSAVLAIVSGIERFAPRVAGVVLSVFVRLPGLVGRALAPLTGIVNRFFGRLGRLASFGVKVLGVDAAINAVVDFSRRVGRIFSSLGATIGDALDRAFAFVERKALEAALAIVEPFTHIPGFLGGGAFRRLKERWQKTLAVMEARANTAARNIQDSINRLQDKTVEITIVTRRVTDAHDRAGAAARPAARRGDAAVAAAAQAAAGAQETERLVSESADTAKKASERAREAFERLIDALELRLDRAQVTKGLRDDLAALGALERAVRARIRAEGRTTELERKLFEIQQQRADVLRQQREALRDARRGRQFQALGLTAEGLERIPSTAALGKRLGTLRDQVAGTFLDTAKTRSQLQRIAKVLSGAFGRVGREVREAIQRMLAEISGELEGGAARGPQTRFVKRGIDKLLEGLGLTPEQVKELRQRFAQLGPGGLAPRRGISAFGMALPAGAGVGAAPPVEVSVFIDGKRVEPVVTRRQQRRRGRSAASRRGVRPGTV